MYEKIIICPVLNIAMNGYLQYEHFCTLSQYITPFSIKEIAFYKKRNFYLEPVEDEAGQICLVCYPQDRDEKYWSNKNNVAETHPKQSPSHFHLPTLDLFSCLKYSEIDSNLGES